MMNGGGMAQVIGRQSNPP